MTTYVTFKVYVDDERYLNEAEVTANLDLYRPGLLEWRHIGGISIFSPETPGNQVEIEEELRYIVEKFCLGCITNLVALEPFSLNYWSSPGLISLIPKDEYICISGDYIPEAKFLNRELLPALYQCGQRYIHFLQQLGEGNDDFDPDTITLEAEAKVARQVLEKAQLI